MSQSEIFMHYLPYFIFGILIGLVIGYMIALKIVENIRNGK